MRDEFVTAIQSVGVEVEAMADLARAMLLQGVASLSGLNRAQSEEVIARGNELAQADEDIETSVLKVLTLQQPMARDLRKMGAALKLITYINRVGRYGYDIAKVARDWPEGQEHVARMVNIRDMSLKVEAMLDMTIIAYRNNVVPDTEAFMALEDEVDAMRYAIFRECLTYMAQDPKNIERCAHYMMVARYLERCADNIVKMVEKIHYSVHGQRLLLD
jgi:phosphate transport system protein